MAKKKPDNAVTTWMEQIRAGEKYRERHSSYRNWDRYAQMYRGDWSDSVIPVNRTFSYGRSMIPNVYFRAPRVCITPRRPEFAPHAAVVQAIDNWLIRELNLKGSIKTAALFTYLYGTGPIKLGYDSEFGFLQEQAVGGDSETVTQLGVQSGMPIESNINVKPGMPWALPASPYDIITPWGYKDPSAFPWICHRIIRPLDDVRQDQKYDRKIRGELQGSKFVELLKRPPNRADFPEGYDQQKLCELLEIRDLREKKIIVISEEKILLNEMDVLQIEGMPYDFLIFNEDPEFFWGIPDSGILEPQQLELNEVKTQQSRHRRVALLKFLAVQGALNPSEIDKFLSGDVGPWIEVNPNVVENVASAITTLQPHMPPELWKEAQLILSDMRESLGFSENQLGGFARQQNKTARETEEVSEGFELRMNERKDIVGDMIERIVRKWNQYIFKFWTTEKVTQVTWMNGEAVWVKYTGDQLVGEYTLNVDVESGFPVSSHIKRNLINSMVARYSGDPMIDQMGLRKLHLSQYEDILPGISNLVIQPRPSIAQAAGFARQPGPMGGGGSSSGNRGGGRQPTSRENPVKFEQFKQQGQGGQ